MKNEARIVIAAIAVLLASACSKNEQSTTEAPVEPVKTPVSSEAPGQPPSAGIALAKRSYEMADRLAPIVYSQSGTIGMEPTLYGRTIDLPTSNLLGEWPPGGGPEDQSLGDLSYCKDALLILNLNAMAGFNRSKSPDEADKQRFKNSLNLCQKALAANGA